MVNGDAPLGWNMASSGGLKKYLICALRLSSRHAKRLWTGGRK
jgi:hypothetical protein